MSIVLRNCSYVCQNLVKKENRLTNDTDVSAIKTTPCGEKVPLGENRNTQITKTKMNIRSAMRLSKVIYQQTASGNAPRIVLKIVFLVYSVYD